MNYGYIRVSTDPQATRNQQFEITRFVSLGKKSLHDYGNPQHLYE